MPRKARLRIRVVSTDKLLFVGIVVIDESLRLKHRFTPLFVLVMVVHPATRHSGTYFGYGPFRRVVKGDNCHAGQENV
jgi:hypothetical protein